MRRPAPFEYVPAKSQVNNVIRYIKNQEIHHHKETFLDEYKKFLTAFEIKWDERYIFKERIDEGYIFTKQ